MQPAMEVMQLDRHLTDQIGMMPLDGRMAQPWARTAPAAGAVRHRLRLLYRWAVDTPLSDVRFATELNITALCCDGKAVGLESTAYYIDPAFRVYALPPLSVGEHRLWLEVEFDDTSPVEPAWLLGDFAVSLSAPLATLSAPVETLMPGDWAGQGLPFYGGAVDYSIECEHPGGPMHVGVPHFKGSLARVALDDGSPQAVAFPPYSAAWPTVSRGRHRLRVTVIGHRGNCFGAVHCLNADLLGSPSSWRPREEDFTPTYQLAPMGLMQEPSIKAGSE